MLKLLVGVLAPCLLLLTVAAQAQGPDPAYYYRLTTQWQGDGKSLDIINDGQNNKPILAATGNYFGQMWKLTPLGNGFYRLTTQWQGDGKSLDIINDGQNNKPILAATGTYSGQMWKLTKLGPAAPAPVPAPAAAPAPAAPGPTVQTLGPISMGTTMVTQPIPSGPTGQSGSLVVGAQPVIVPPGSAAPQAPLSVTGLIGPVGKSGTTCGGVNQPLCPDRPAELVRNASNECPAGSFMDVGKWSCWQCPDGYERSPAAVDTDRACRKYDANARGDFGSATFRGPLCPAGSFHDPIRGGECYSCPPGYTRSWAHIDAGNSCYVPAGERLSAATRIRQQAFAWDCPTSTFWDGYNGGACWTCPDGFVRTANHIAGDNACSAYVSEKQARATLVQKAQCAAGEFYDMKIPGTQDSRTGGGCWTCPTAWDRTIFPVDGNQACEKDGRYVFQRAQQTKTMTCESGEIFDLVNSNHSGVRTRLVEANTRLSAAGQPTLSAAAGGGTCWKCPPGSIRTAKAVYEEGACTPPGIEWKSAGYAHAGLFGLAGAEEVALALVRDGTAINLMADQMAPALGKQPANMRREVWEEIATAPQASSILKVAVLWRLKEVALNPAIATPADKLLLESTAAAMRNFRVFMAQDALDAYDAWYNGKPYRKNLNAAMYAQSRVAVMYDIDLLEAPDFDRITAETIMAGLLTGGGLSTAGTVALLNPQVFGQVFPYALRASTPVVRTAATTAGRGAYVLAEGGAQASLAAARTAQGGVTLARNAALKLSAQFLTKFLGMGPQIVVTFASEMLAIMIERIVDRENARPKLVANLATARNAAIDFGRMMGTGQGQADLENQWTTIMSGTNMPTDVAQFSAVAQARVR